MPAEVSTEGGRPIIHGRLRIAVVGGGVSGLFAARLLAARHQVVLFEAADYVGGHACTLPIQIDGKTHPVDIGFMVFNDRTYPIFCRFLQEWEIPVRSSDMSFSVSCARTGIEFQGSGWSGLFAKWTNAINPRFYRLLAGVIHFNRVVNREMSDTTWLRAGPDESLAEFIRRQRLTDDFRDLYLLPMASAIWSAQQCDVLKMPARFLLQFFHNHGLTQLRNRPQWCTIEGGAQRYVQHMISDGLFDCRLRCPVELIERDGQVVSVHAEGRRSVFDRVVLGLHADQALNLLQDASDDEQVLLRSFRYQDNNVVLHTDSGQMPQSRAAWASWNYRVSPESGQGPTVTYWLNSLQGHSTRMPLFVTLNPPQNIASQHVLRQMTLRHPVFSRETWSAQRSLEKIQGYRNTFYCGAYWGNGFHEDGVRSAVAVAKQLGVNHGDE